MRYYLDTEFIEGPQKRTFLGFDIGLTKPTIDLISIGIVSEDNQEYYAISKDFNLKEAWNRYDWRHDLGAEPQRVYWLRENVLKPIWRELFLLSECDAHLSNSNAASMEVSLSKGEFDQYFTFKSIAGLITRFGRSNTQIADEIKNFVYVTSQINDPEAIGNWSEVKHLFPVEFYAYYADYDWVVFCWLFGKMVKLPKGFPKYCRDLKQTIDETVHGLQWYYGRDIWANTTYQMCTYGRGPLQKADRLATFDEKLERIENLNEYPKQINNHNALADAKWGKEFHDFIFALKAAALPLHM